MAGAQGEHAQCMLLRRLCTQVQLKPGAGRLQLDTALAAGGDSKNFKPSADPEEQQTVLKLQARSSGVPGNFAAALVRQATCPVLASSIQGTCIHLLHGSMAVRSCTCS